MTKEEHIDYWVSGLNMIGKLLKPSWIMKSTIGVYLLVIWYWRKFLKLFSYKKLIMLLLLNT